ncbi:MAG: Hsp20/alpha crystallin family protein [Lachnospiraceae bacterium]|nr:Hsp20/alpha crystallin family protein [Lachnospiraceae bacterium]
MLRPALFEATKPMFFDNAFDKFFENAFTDFWGNGLSRSEGFNTDVLDQGDHYLLQAELPGFNKEDINIDLADDKLTISAAHQEENNEEDKKHNYIRKERRYNSYTRSFFVEGVTPDDINASYKDGILEVTFPKKELAAAEEPKRIEVK